ncbi:MAG TPA: caspase family protein [Albitalea sp.]|nr:caspase family protein [Albitalea sp.]
MPRPRARPHLSSSTRRPIDRQRRQALALSWASALAASGWGSSVHAQGETRSAEEAAADGANSPRLALLIGNRAYPPPFDLPPVHKNIRDMTAALDKRGFAVTAAVDQDPAALRATIDAFAKSAQAAPPNATVLFYFTGHGMQVDAENLLLGAGVAPDAKENVLLGNSLHLRRDVINVLPRRVSGLSIAVVDACRTSLRATLNATDGFNQVEAPPGCLIAFSTAAGKPAIAPAVETLNTFYTGSLVKLLMNASDDLSFSDFFRLVKLDVQNTMLNHPIAAIRSVAQIPFIAENTQVRFRLTPRGASAVAVPQFSAAEEGALWKELSENQWPADVLRLSDDYLKRYPTAKLAGSAEVAREGAGDAVKALRSNEVRLYRSAFLPKVSTPALAEELRKAARGDKDAAARIARIYASGHGEIERDPNRYEGWMQYASALGNGIASYELAVYYRRQGQPTPAAQYESRARELAYTPPPTLDNVRK